jgi:hypothetical protein
LLGGVASASVLGVGVAAPTLARPVSHVRDLSASSWTQVVPPSALTRLMSASALTRVVSASAGTRVASASSRTREVPTGSAARRVGCDLPGLPQAGPVVSAMAGALGAPCGSSDTPGGSWSDLTGAGSPAGPAGPADPANASSRATSTLRGGSAVPSRSAVTNAVPGLSVVTSAVPGLSAVTSVVPDLSTARLVIGGLASASVVKGALSSLGGAFGGAWLGSQQS